MKAYYLKPNRKKIRGWPRRVKQLEAWGEAILQPNTEMFEKWGYTYERCILSPFYKLIKRQPPQWFYKIIIGKFSLAYQQWKKVFEEIEKPYDLMLWIYDPRFPTSEIIRSEIYCREVERKGDTVGGHWETDGTQPFPAHLLDGPFFNSAGFKWFTMPEELIIEEYEIEEDGWDIDGLIKEGYRQKTRKEDGATYYARQIGNIWVGRIK